MVIEEPDPCLSAEQKTLVDKLTDEQINEIDELILSFSVERNRKVAFIVGSSMSMQE